MFDRQRLGQFPVVESWKTALHHLRHCVLGSRRFFSRQDPQKTGIVGHDGHAPAEFAICVQNPWKGVPDFFQQTKPWLNLFLWKNREPQQRLFLRQTPLLLVQQRGLAIVQKPLGYASVPDRGESRHFSYLGVLLRG